MNFDAFVKFQKSEREREREKKIREFIQFNGIMCGSSDEEHDINMMI